MSYHLGIDLGTTFSTAAVVRDGAAEVLSLSTRSSSVPSVVFIRDDGEVLVGEAAEARAVTEPDRVAREFKRRLGDPTPLVLGGAPYGAERLSAIVLEYLLRRVTERMAEAPLSVVVTHPATYSPYRLDLLRETTRLAGIPSAVLLPEPQGSALQYAFDHRVDDGQVVAVYDFGGGTFDAAVVRATPAGFDLLGEPQGLDRLGGIDIDQAVFDHVRERAAELLDAADPRDSAWRSSLARLRTECRLAKERLSEDTDTVIGVVTPGGSQGVTLTRAALESMVRPRLVDTVRTLQRAVESAGLLMADVSRILMVGGTSRIPLVRVMVAEATGRPIAVDADPETATALGAARHAYALASPRAASAVPAVMTPPPAAPLPPSLSPPPPPPPPPVPPVPAPAAAPAPAPVRESQPIAPAPVPFVSPVPSSAVGPAGSRRALLFAVAVVVVLLLGGGAWLAFGNNSDSAASATLPIDTSERTTVVPVTDLPVTVAPTAVPDTVTPTVTPTTASAATVAPPPAVIEGFDLSTVFVAPDGFTFTPFDPAVLQQQIIDPWQQQLAVAPSLGRIGGAQLVDGSGTVVGQVTIFFGSSDDPLPTAVSDSLVVSVTTEDARVVSTQPLQVDRFAGTQFTRNDNVAGWVAVDGATVTMVFATPEAIVGVVNSFVTNNV